MVGTDLNLDLPSLSDTLATIVSKLVTALEAVEDSHADRVTPGGLDINTTLDLGGNALSNVSALSFVAGNAPSTPGTLFFFDGDFYGIDDVGTIKLTDNGAINAAGIGGIVGDYGGVNPAAVSFNDLAGQYEFTEDTGVYADIVVDDLVLTGTNGEVRIGVHDDINTSRDILIQSLPTADISLLAYDASDNCLKDAATVQITNDVSLTTVTAVEYKQTAGESRRIGMAPATVLTNCGLTYDNGAMRLVTTASAWEWDSPALPLRTGDKVIAATINIHTAVAGDIQVDLCKYDTTGFSVVSTDTIGITIAGNYTVDITAHAALTSTQYYFWRVQGVPSASGVSIRSIGYTYTHP